MNNTCKSRELKADPNQSPIKPNAQKMAIQDKKLAMRDIK